MIVNNTQANIFKVNGGLADNFANRPAANGSFYIFYSLDTQEIYYDNGAWILIGSSAGGGVNIYNSNGTLTGNRILSGANNDLNFADLNVFKTSVGGNDIGLKLDFANNIYQFGKFNDNYLKIDVTNGLIDLGFDGSQILFRVDNINNNVKIGDFNAFNYQTFLLIDDANQLIKTSNQGNDIGLLLDFANSVYQFGQITGGNQSIIKIDDTNQIVNIQKSAIDGGIEVGLLNNYVRLGDWFLLYGGHYIDIIPTRINMTAGGTNTPALAIDSAVDFIRSFYQSNNIGINLDFANSLYQFGQINGGFLNQLVIDDANQIMGFKNGGFYQGFKYDVASLKPYQFGQITSGNLTSIYVNDNAEKISASINNADNGLILDFQNGIEIFGDVNDCYIQLEQGNSYQFQINGTNVLSGTSGGNSGQHLKIKVNGVDYKIELKNP